MNSTNRVRAYHYLAGVLANQQKDVFCGRCSAWNNSLNNIRESFKEFETEQGAGVSGFPAEVSALLADARSRLALLANYPDPAGQKKAGNCKLPEGVCFVKASKALLEKV
jgi:hypothetical protein